MRTADDMSGGPTKREQKRRSNIRLALVLGVLAFALYLFMLIVNPMSGG